MAPVIKNPVVIAELIYLLFKFGDAMLEPSVRLYIFEGVCLLELKNISDCQDLGNHLELERKVHTASTGYLLAYNMLMYVPATILSLFAGSWCDRIGRKIPIVLPCFGTILAVLMYMLSMVSGRQAMLPLVLVGSALRGLVGKTAVIDMALNSFVSDVTSKEERTEKLGQLLALNYFGYFLGSLLTGTILVYTRYDVIFSVVLLVMALAGLLALLLLPESLPQASIIHSDDVGIKEKVCALRKSPFHMDHLQDLIEVLNRPRHGRSRLHLVVQFSVFALTELTGVGENDITLLIVKRYPLLWDESTYVYLFAVDFASLGLGAMVLLPILVRFFHTGDMTLVITGLVFKVVRMLMLAFSDVTWIVFMAVVLGTPVALVISGCKSIISQSVNEDELGRVFSLLSCVEMINTLVGSLIFTSLYTASISMFPGFVFTLDAGVYVAAVLLVAGFAYRLHLDKRFELLNSSTQDYPDYGSSKPSDVPDKLDTEGLQAVE